MITGIDFFDVDHTTTRSSTGREFVFTGIQSGLFPVKTLFKTFYFWVIYRFGNFDYRFFDNGMPILKGISREDLEAAAQLSFVQKTKSRIIPKIESLIRKSKAEGRVPVFASTSIDILLFPLAKYLGVQHIIASSLEFNSSVCTGKFSSMPTFGPEKCARVLSFIREAQVSLSDCSFYTDSYHDIPLLEKVGKPVAVNPDRRLKIAAKQRGWKILKV